VRKLHYISGLIITAFIGLHLFNHCWGIFGAEQHIEMMNSLRLLYRNIFVEPLLLIAVLVQIYSGVHLYRINRKKAITGFEKLHIWTGLYLAFFLVIHVTAIMVGRYFFHFDTNYYFSAIGFTFPYYFFFFPYYSLAILSFFGHIAAVHYKKMKKNLLGLTPTRQSKVILFLGVFITLFVFYGLTNHFTGVNIPTNHNILIGK